jgi:tetratricopeptide (TPR) repeat protein
MRTLLGSLETDTGLHRVWWGAATVAFAGVVTWGVAAQPEERRCSGAAAQWDGIWDDARREELRLAFERVDLPFSGAAWQRTVLALDDYTERWSGHYTDACEAGEGPASSASSELDAKMKCLHRAKLQVVSVVELLADADVEVVERAHLLTGGLRPSSQCVDPNRLADEVEPPPPHEMDAVDAIMKQVDEARSAFDAGRVDEARAKVDKARRLLTEVEYEPVRTSVEMAHAGILEAYGDFTGAEAAYQEALRLASVWQQREQMAMAAANLAHIVGAMELRTEDAKRFVEMARQVEIDDPLVNAWRTRLMAGVARASGDSAEAEAAYREALAIEEELLGPDHETVAATRMRLALVVAEQGRLAEAESEMKVGFEVLERKLGRGHPTARDGLNNLAIVIERRGRLVEAEAIYREILDEIVATFGPGHPDESDTRNNLAAVLEQEGRIDEALVEHRRALAIREEALGLRHPDVGVSHLNIGSNLGQQGRYAEAEQETLLALEILEPVVGRDHPHLASAYFNMTRDLLEQSKFEKARETGRRSWEIHERSDLPPGYKAEAAIAYSAALSASNEPTDLERARDLAREARSLCEIDPSWRAECIEEVERWVQKYPGLSTADGPGPSSSPPAPK